MKKQCNNVRFKTNDGRLMFGTRYGYAIRYSVNECSLGIFIKFSSEPLLMAEDVMNTEMPYPADLASQCLYEMAQESGTEGILVNLYGRFVKFSSTTKLYEIEQTIRKFQKKCISIRDNMPTEVRRYVESKMDDIIKNMPLY